MTNRTYTIEVTEVREVICRYVVRADTWEEAYQKACDGDFQSREECCQGDVVNRLADKDTVEPD